MEEEKKKRWKLGEIPVLFEGESTELLARIRINCPVLEEYATGFIKSARYLLDTLLIHKAVFELLHPNYVNFKDQKETLISDIFAYAKSIQIDLKKSKEMARHIKNIDNILLGVRIGINRLVEAEKETRRLAIEEEQRNRTDSHAILSTVGHSRTGSTKVIPSEQTNPSINPNEGNSTTPPSTRTVRHKKLVAESYPIASITLKE